MQHVYSIDNPYLYDIFANSKDPNSPYAILTHKKRPQNICVYGSSLHTYTFISGLIKEGVEPERIFLVIPPRAYDIATKFNSNAERIAYEDQLINNPEAFNDNSIRKAILDSLQRIGVNISDHFQIDRFWPEDGAPEKMQFITLKNPKNNDEPGFECRILVTSTMLDVSDPIFNAIQDNGLVYNGRLIVKNNYQCTDKNIFACGEICQFSQIYKNYSLGKSLMMDRYSGRELGQKLARSILEYINILSPIDPNDPSYEELPAFQMPVGQGGYLPNGYIYYQVKAIGEGKPQNLVAGMPNREPIISNCLEKSDHYIKFSFDNNGLINSVTYLGKEHISVPSLLSLIGLSETYLNRLEERSQAGSNLIHNLSEFLSENWAMALYHEWFSEFRYNLKVKLTQDKELRKIMEQVGDHATTGKY